ncbi:hypothetical protein J6590_043779 [Homalodisca vitripennis]|nr:hypothetical protein J6590_043779 [Homalodisca vitripennis]
MADGNEPEVPVKRRKFFKQVRYKCEVIKEARVKGESYTNWKGNRVERKRKGEDCKCSMKCFERVGEGNIKEINDRFYSFGSKNEQDAYLQSLITESATNPKPRAHSYTYRVSCNTGSYPVCKKSFIAMHGITAMRVRLDLRVKNRPGNAKPGSEVKLICDHIEQFGRPQVDTCVTREELGVKIESVRLKDVVKRAAVKNNTIVQALLALVDKNRLEKIEQYFPVRGHSFMPCDRDFAVIKRKRRKAREYIDGLDAHTFKLGTGENVVLPREKALTRGTLPLKRLRWMTSGKFLKAFHITLTLRAFGEKYLNGHSLKTLSQILMTTAKKRIMESARKMCLEGLYMSQCDQLPAFRLSYEGNL